MVRILPRLAPAALMLLTPLAGCAPDLGKAPAPRSAATLATVTSLPDERGAWPGEGWWRAYGDTQLDQLIGEALAGSPDVATAGARFARALGQARGAGAALLPTGEANASVGGSKQSYNNGFPAEYVPHGIKSVGNLNVQLGLDLDLFGRARANRRAAVNEAEAARIDAAQARLALAAGVAAAYADLARLYDERDVAAETVRLQADSARLVGQRVENGLDTEGERSQANALIPAANVDLAAVDENILDTRHQLAALLGAGPDRGLAIARPKLAITQPQALPSAAGITLVGRRPDIAAARLRAEAAGQRVKAAKAAYYPNVTLSALAGVQSLGLRYLVDSGSTYGNAGPALTLPLFDLGRIGSQYRVARADYDAAVAAYDSTLLVALREVADAVAGRESVAQQQRNAAQSLLDSENAYRIARLRYEGGLSTYVAVLSAEQNVIAARRRTVDLAARGVTLDIALVRALGGGFSDTGN